MFEETRPASLDALGKEPPLAEYRVTEAVEVRSLL